MRIKSDKLSCCCRMFGSVVKAPVSLGTVTRSTTRCLATIGHTPAAPQVSLPTEADVVVIGGGSVGCSTLYHLTKLGVTNTVLLEAHKLTAGTTWHTAGLVWRLRPSDTELTLLRVTRDLLLRLEGETGVNPGWINNGGLFIANSKERLKEYKRLFTLGKLEGIESFVLSPEETKKLYPLMNVSDVHGTLYSPGDGTVDPTGYCNALTRFATRAGAKLIEGCRVNAIRTKENTLGGRKVTEVHTQHGIIKTNCVVNATGCWSRDIASMVSISIPLVPMKHSYVITEKISGIENMPNIRDHDGSIYLRLQGDALAVGGYEVNPHILDKVEHDFAFGLFDLDWDVFSAHINASVHRVPVLKDTGIKSTVCGPESFTPDHKPLMGEDPNVEGFFHCCGFNSAGMMLSGGCGDQIAKWVVHGRPELDMFSYDIRRFNRKVSDDVRWAKERSHEAYAKNYSVVYPHDEPLAGRRMKASPLHPILEELGCFYQERHGWERPGWFHKVPVPTIKYDWYGAYGNPKPVDSRYSMALESSYSFDFPPFFDVIKNECLTCRNKAVIFDMSYFGKFYITGRDAQKAADWLFTANMKREPGATVYTCMCNDRGGTEADLTVSILEGGSGSPCDSHFSGRGFYMAVGGAAALQNWAHIVNEIRKHQWDITLIDHSDDMALISLQGPMSREILRKLTDADLSNEAFPFSTHKVINVAGQRVRALRLSFVGELGWELHVPNESAVRVYKALMKEGAAHDLKNAGYRAMDSLSAEKGYRHWHADVRIDDTPLEAGLGFSCKLKTDTPFLGRKALEEQKRQGLRKKLVTFTLKDSDQALWGLETLWREGVLMGMVRRAEFAFHLGATIGYGYVRHPAGGNIDNELLKTGEWFVESMGNRYSINIHLKPPFDPSNDRLKGNYDWDKLIDVKLP